MSEAWMNVQSFDRELNCGPCSDFVRARHLRLTSLQSNAPAWSFLFNHLAGKRCTSSPLYVTQTPAVHVARAKTVCSVSSRSLPQPRPTD
jgi:hypothetical protein